MTVLLTNIPVYSLLLELRLGAHSASSYQLLEKHMSPLVRELSFNSCNCHALQNRASSAQPTPLAYKRLKQVPHNPAPSEGLQNGFLPFNTTSVACTVAPLRDCLGSSLISATTGFDFIVRLYVDTPQRLHGCYQCVSFFVHALTTHVRAVTFQRVATEEKDSNR